MGWRQSNFGTYVAFGLTTIFALQGLVNTGVVLGALPAKGLTLLAVGKALSEHSHEHIALEARDLPALFRLGEQPAQHLHPCDVVLAELLSQGHQRGRVTCFGEGRERRMDAPPPDAWIWTPHPPAERGEG